MIRKGCLILGCLLLASGLWAQQNLLRLIPMLKAAGGTSAYIEMDYNASAGGNRSLTMSTEIEFGSRAKARAQHADPGATPDTAAWFERGRRFLFEACASDLPAGLVDTLLRAYEDEQRFASEFNHYACRREKGDTVSFSLAYRGTTGGAYGGFRFGRHAYDGGMKGCAYLDMAADRISLLIYDRKLEKEALQKPDVSKLDRWVEGLEKRQDVESHDVSYTHYGEGSCDFLFCKGNGVTHGRRYVVEHAEEKDYAGVVAEMEAMAASCQSLSFVVSKSSHEQTFSLQTKSGPMRIFMLRRVDDGPLYVLRVTAEGDVLVPYGWHQPHHYYYDRQWK